MFASNDPTSFDHPANLCHVSTRETSLPGNWMRLKCKKIFTSRYVFVQADAKMDNSNQELTICEMKASGCFYLFTGKQNTQQECIPVGCVPPAAVAVCWGVSASVHAGIHTTPGVCLETPPQVWAWRPPSQLWAWRPPRPATHAGIPPPPMNRMTERHM